MRKRIITIKIDPRLNFEIEFIKSKLGLTNTTSVFKHAIHALYITKKQTESQKTSLEIFEELGLMGCIEDNTNLSIL